MKIFKARAIHLKAPIENVYETTFDKLKCRQAVIILLESDSGIMGIGETYVNFPVWAPSGRMSLYKDALFPEIVGKTIDNIPAFMNKLWDKFYRQSLQGNSLGALIQAISALSCALWDIAAKQANLPLYRMFEGSHLDSIRVYGSGINPPIPEHIIEEALEKGIRIFKLKFGYGDSADKANFMKLRSIAGNSAKIAVDVNRSWSFNHTVEWFYFLNENGAVWLEEPLSPQEQYLYPDLFDLSPVPISAGENFLIPPGSDFETEKESGLDLNETELSLHIIQPAVVKNCCFDDAARLVQKVEISGKKIFPHFLGSAPGTALSAHLAALTAEPHLEWDINPNPLRTGLFKEPFEYTDGFLKITERPGIGWSLNEKMLSEWTFGEVTQE